jgi:hypothetical protein
MTADIPKVRSLPYHQWAPRIRALLKAGDDESALALSLECEEAALAAASWAAAAPPFYVLTAARILHRRHDYESELDLLVHHLAVSANPDVESARRRAEAALLPLSCPDCGSVLAALASVCPYCGAHLVRNGGRLLTNEGSEREQVMHRVGRFGIDERQWTGLEQSMAEASLGDLYMAAVDTALARERTTDNWPKEREILFDLARYQAETGQPWVETCRRADDLYLWLVQRYDPATEFIISGCTCVPCQAGPLVMSAGQYLEARPVPHERCERPPCRCAGHRPI